MSIPRPRAGPARVDLSARLRAVIPRGRGLDTPYWERRHRGIVAILGLHAVAIPIFGIANGYGAVHSIAEGGLVAMWALAARWTRLGRVARMACVSVGLLTASALLVHFSGGYIEFHFHFFVMIGLLALYQHWLPFLLAIGYVFVHHGLAGALAPETVYNHPDAIAHPWKWAAIHGAFVLGASAVSIFAWRVSELEQKRRHDLQRVTEAALARLPLPRLLDEILLRLMEIVNADVATVWLLDEDRNLIIRAGSGLGAVRDLRPTDGLTLERQIAETGEPVILDDVSDDDQLNAHYRQLGVRSFAGAPLLVEGEAIGLLDVGAMQPVRFSQESLDLLQLAADRIAPAIDRARLHEREHLIAETLQRSLLPKRLPPIPGIDVAVCYLPAGEGIEVGGDWYDVLELPSGRVAVALGDVAGHGTAAAALMGQVRTALRAYAIEGHPPCEVMNRLDALIADLDGAHMATALYLEIDPEDAAVRYVAAGHPPPLHRLADGSVEHLDAGRRPPLGVPPVVPFAVGEAHIRPGSTFVLYTDGLLERRDVAIDTRIAQLETVIGDADGLNAEAFRDRVLQELLPAGGARDDVAVLVLQSSALVELKQSANLQRTGEEHLPIAKTA